MLKTRKYITSELNLVDQFYQSVLNKSKTSTIRLGYVFFESESLMLNFKNNPPLTVKLKSVNYSKCLKDLDEKDAVFDGFSTLVELKTALYKFYPNCADNSVLTVVHFELID